ncbi:MAG: DNA polymerase Y family protein [Armatimonadetes bacterium]|jgi:DNA polymerase-4|nr:DNA polymerase Y family protein [Armatimonadota bacterium]MCA1997891.1 DNA polymerase Y family protein [Armatimonadota bacterium]
MFVYLCVSRFYVRNLGRDRDPSPVVVLAGDRVLDANEAAARRGVEPGMGRAICKTLVPEAELLAWRADDHRDSQRAWLEVCCRHSGAVEPQEQHEAFVDLSAHPCPEDVLGRLAGDLRDAGYPVRWGASVSKWVARLAMEEGAGGSVWRDPAGFLAPLPVARLTPVPPEHRERLELLGYRRIGQVAAIPLERLRAAFGADALRIHRAARGGLSDPVRPIYPPLRALGRFRFHSPVEQAEAVEAGLVRLARQLAGRMRAGDLQGTRLSLTLETESGAQTRQRDFAKPMRSEASVLFALRLLWRSMDVREPVEALAAEIPELKPSDRRQASLYRVGAANHGEQTEPALAPLLAKFGEHAVRPASQLEQTRSKRVLRAWKEGLGWI